MEVCFIPGIGQEKGLRQLTRKQLDFLCTEAKCSILSKISSAYMDAYVLSESSLFIYKHRCIMKTCGTTTLLHCLDSLLRFADELEMELMWVGYSRKNLLFPTQQAWPHSNFGDEIEYLNSHKLLQDRLNGVAHILGPVTGDHWFVYVADNPPHMAALVEAHHRVKSLRSNSPLSKSQHEDSYTTAPVVKSKSASNFSSTISVIGPGSGGMGVDLASSMMTMEGITINMMMFDLDREVAKLFYQPSETGDSAAAMGKRMTKAAGIDYLVPGATIDECSFSPCGYSMNAILHDAYSTIHVTPEPECSYASFETNTALRTYSPLVRNALNVFRPQRFVLTMFADEVAYSALQEGAVPVPLSSKELFVPRIGTYRRTNLSSTKIGVDLNCTMACFTLVTPLEGENSGSGIWEKEGERSSSGGEEWENEEDVTLAEGGVTRRVRGNTVDLTIPCSSPPLTAAATVCL